jgi:SIR2-like domain
MENVVYFLGAGFSAPLGIPVMSEFFQRSVELHDRDPKKFTHFENVFKYYEKMAVSSTYYSSNLLNIEELLSILEMRRELGLLDDKPDFTKYIADVINESTPGTHLNWTQDTVINALLGPRVWQPYVAFASALHQVCFRAAREHSTGQDYYPLSPTADKQINYSVITLNYDLVLEKACHIISQSGMQPVAFLRDETQYPGYPKGPWLAKLHGSIDSEVIVPPTWNKSLAPKGIKETWKFACELLSRATQIRFIGYSLPATDSYIKHLLQTAVNAPPKIKRIDILCLDGSGSVQKRFGDFISFDHRFLNAPVQVYLSRLLPSDASSAGVSFDLEEVHSDFFR